MLIYFALLGLLVSSCSSLSTQSTRPENIVALSDIDPTIVQEIRYAGAHNFMGRPIKGYQAEKCYLTRPAAQALKEIQAQLKKQKYGLKVYDCYRPQKAVDDFIAWAKDPADLKMKKEFYPLEEKATLFEKGYIASRSGHSRGSTIDLTIIPMPAPKQEVFAEGNPQKECFLSRKKRFGDNSVDMGTGYDCFDTRSHTMNPTIQGGAFKNRVWFKRVMEKNGFKNYEKEWWHYTLKNEPYPDTFFDFNVE